MHCPCIMRSTVALGLKFFIAQHKKGVPNLCIFFFCEETVRKNGPCMSRWLCENWAFKSGQIQFLVPKYAQCSETYAKQFSDFFYFLLFIKILIFSFWDLIDFLTKKMVVLWFRFPETKNSLKNISTKNVCLRII